MTIARDLLPRAVDKLRADAGVTALAGERVYGAAFASAVFPFVALGPVKAKAWNAGGERGEEIVFAVHCFARRGGREAAVALAEACGTALDNAQLALTGARLVALFYQDADVALEKDRETWRAVARFRALVEAE